MSPMFRATSAISSSSKQYLTSSVITSRTLAVGPLPSATPRIAMSRSVIMPTRRSWSPTGSAPASRLAIMRAACCTVSSGFATHTSCVMASLTFISTLLSFRLLSCATTGLALLGRGYNALLRRNPEFAQVGGQRALHLLDLAAGNMAGTNQKHRLDGHTGIDRPHIRQPFRYFLDEGVESPVGRPFRRLELIVIDATHQQREFRAEMRREVEGQTIAQFVEHHREHFPRQLPIGPEPVGDLVEPD